MAMQSLRAVAEAIRPRNPGTAIRDARKGKLLYNTYPGYVRKADRTGAHQRNVNASFMIGYELFRETRWRAGEAVDVLFDKEINTGVIRLSQGSRWGITYVGSHPKPGQDPTRRTMQVRFTIYPGMGLPECGMVNLDFRIVKGEIQFSFPAELPVRVARPYTRRTES